MQLVPLCFDSLDDVQYGFEYQTLFCEACVGGVVDIIQAGFERENEDYMPDTQIKHLSNFEGFAYFLLGSLIQYQIMNKNWTDDTILLPIMPFPISAELWIQGRYRDGIKLIERNTTIPCKKSETISDDNCTIVILFLGKRFSIDIKDLFHYNPKSIEIIVDIDPGSRVKYTFKDKEMKKEYSISQTEIFNYEVKTNNEDTTW